MGIEDRDWYREEPSRAWKDRRRGSRGNGRSTPTYPSSDDWYGTKPAPTAGRSFGGVALRAGVWSAIAVSAVATAVMWKFDLLSVSLPAPGSAPVTQLRPANNAVVPPPPAPSTAPNVVRLGSDPALAVPVSAVTKWSVSDPRFGVVSVYVPVGQTPRQALVIELAERGFQVVG